MHSYLPAPTQLSQDQLEAEERIRTQKSYSTALVASRKEPPPYGHRKGWVPRAFEVHFNGLHIGSLPSFAFLQNILGVPRTSEMAGLFQRFTWPSFLWRWAGRRRPLTPWQFKWTQKGKSNMMPLPDKDRLRIRYLSFSSFWQSVRSFKTLFLLLVSTNTWEVLTSWFYSYQTRLCFICIFSHKKEPTSQLIIQDTMNFIKLTWEVHYMTWQILNWPLKVQLKNRCSGWQNLHRNVGPNLNFGNTAWFGCHLKKMHTIVFCFL